MQYTTLGRTGLKVSRLCLGTMNFGPRTTEPDSFAIMDKALELGIQFFDTADVYGGQQGKGITESILGRWFKQGGNRREQVVLATKVFGSMKHDGLPDVNLDRGLSARKIILECENSLRRLQTDWIDLYQQHQPDPRTPIEETLRALDDLVRQGKVRYIGNSNFASWQLADADWTARQLGLNRFVSAQDELSLVFRKAEAEQLPACERFGLGFLPFFPLASGLLTGKHQGGKAAEGSRLANTQRLADRYMTPANLATVERLRGWCEKRGMSMVDLAFGWLLAKPQVSSVIAGATRPEQLEQNVKAGETKLSAEDLAEITKLLEG